MRSRFVKESFFSVPKQELFSFHEREDAFSLLTPAWHKIDVLSTASTLEPSDEVVRFVARMFPFSFKFGMVHTDYQPPDMFADEQKEGLFSSWRHEHRFIQAGWENDPASLLSDQIEYAHPLLPSFNLFVQQRLKQIFEYRHDVTRQELIKGGRKGGEGWPERVIVTGATGLIGGRITEILVEKGVEVVAFARNVEKARKVLGDTVTCAKWDFNAPEKGNWREHIDQAGAVIHLAGTPLFKQRWTPAFKREMEESRIQGTRQLVEAIKASARQPESFISASAVGIYGGDPELVAGEETQAADDLLARICVGWEDEARRLEEDGVRTLQMRIGIVLSTISGAVKELLPVFWTGMGGVMGRPEPWINWIHLEDVARIFVMALANREMQGPYNIAAPKPARNKDFCQTLARVLGRPSLMQYPVPVVKLMIGEAGEYSSGGARAVADRVLSSGYTYFFDELEPALRNVLERT
jgi:uncharacterized protein (TIGR01777 family)